MSMPDHQNIGYLKQTRAIGMLMLLCLALMSTVRAQEARARARALGLEPGILSTGRWNAITDVKGVKVGHRTLIEADSIRTGVTVILPHEANPFQEKVPAAVFVGNGFGKAMGFTQIEELGNIETPIALTNTLNAPLVANGLLDYILSLPGNENVRSVNAVVGETNDGYLNAIRSRAVKEQHVLEAIQAAGSGPVQEGNVGAGTGTRCLGFKGGIGTSSRVLPSDKGGYTVGVLVQTNFGGILTINGAPVGERLKNYYMAEDVPYVVDGSCMIVIATDAPLSVNNLRRLAKRSFLAFGKVGSFSSNGSGDYSIAFTTHPQHRIPYRSEKAVQEVPVLRDDQMSPLFLAVVEATEEAIYNSLFMAEDMNGYQNHSVKALPIQETLQILKEHQVIHQTHPGNSKVNHHE